MDLLVAPEGASIMLRLLDLILPESPYMEFPASQYVPDLHGWEKSAPIFAELVEAQRPHLILDVGSGKGGSAIAMGRACQDFGIPCEIVCVDTWLIDPGCVTAHAGTSRFSALKYRWGYPQVYYSFLRNIVDAGLEDYITPLAQTPDGGAQVIARLGVAADLVYLHAGTDADVVPRELRLYWDLLCPDGMILGDAYSEEEFPELCRAVRAFAARVSCPLYVRGRHYVISRLSSDWSEAADPEDEERWWRFLATTYDRRSAMPSEPERPEGPLVLHDVGPNKAVAGIPFSPLRDGTSAMWVRCENATSRVLVQFDGVPLRTRFKDPTRLTAALPLDCYRRPGLHAVTLRDPFFASNAVAFVVAPE